MNTRFSNLRDCLTVSSLVLGLIGLSACSMMAPPTSRTGEIHDVTIEETVAPAILTVGVDDEVRWVNHRTDDVRIDFLEDALDQTSCQRGFTAWTGTQKESATIGASKSASLCFKKAGVVTYTVRMNSPVPGGKQIVHGEVRVGRSGGAAGVH